MTIFVTLPFHTKGTDIDRRDLSLALIAARNIATFFKTLLLFVGIVRSECHGRFMMPWYRVQYGVIYKCSERSCNTECSAARLDWLVFDIALAAEETLNMTTDKLTWPSWGDWAKRNIGQITIAPNGDGTARINTVQWRLDPQRQPDQWSNWVPWHPEQPSARALSTITGLQPSIAATDHHTTT